MICETLSNIWTDPSQLKDLEPILGSLFKSKPRRILDIGCGNLDLDGQKIEERLSMSQ